MLHRPIAACLAVLLACAAAPARTQDALKRITLRQQVNIGYAENAAPFSFRAGGRPAGYSVELCSAVAAHLKRELGRPELPVTFVSVDQDAVMRLLRGSSLDLLCAGVSDTPERRKIMAFSAPIFLSSVKLLVRAEDGPRSVGALKGKSVAVIGRTTAETVMNDLNKQQGLGIEVSRVVSPDAALSQVRLRQSEAWARDEVLLLSALGRQPDAQKFSILPDGLSTEVIAIAMPRDEELQRVVGAALAELVRSGRMEALYEKWFVQPHAASPKGLKIPLSPQLKAEFERLR